MYIVDKKTMRRAEELSVAEGREWFDLMQSAGRAAAAFIAGECAPVGKTALILCGKGNNGGDGFVIAKELSFMGADVTVALTHGRPATAEAERAFLGLPGDVDIVDLQSAEADGKVFDITVDAVFGTGFAGEPDEGVKNYFIRHPFVDYAVDLPSCIVCDTGEGAQFAPVAGCTLTFAALKLCHILPQSAKKCGRMIRLDIGVSDAQLKAAGAVITDVTPERTQKRDKNAFKNSFGVGLSVCGSYGMPGAALLSGKAALRSGIGILKLACVKENYTACAATLPEAVLLPLNSQGKTFSADAIDPLKDELGSVDALLIGCGLGISEDAKRLVKELLVSTEVPTVLDADGINLIADDIELLRNVKAPVILTPHPGEMARLLKVTPRDVERDRLNIAADFARRAGVCLVLKGANTVIADKNGGLSVNLTGNPGMATAGSGDMLAGILLALLAKGYAPDAAARSAVWYHSAAGDAARSDLSEESMLPTDMIDRLYRFL